MAEQPLRVGLIGLGTISRDVVRLVEEQGGGRIALIAALARDPNRPRPAGSPKVVIDLPALLAEDPEVVVEMAGHEALRSYGPGVLRSGRDLLFLSVGALSDRAVEQELREAAAVGGARAQLVSGAIGALDAIAAAAVGGLTRVTHTTRKPPRALLEPAEAASLREPLELYRGSAREGTKRFPENVNVAAAVSLAGLGLDRTELRVIADPAVTRNQHTVDVEGAFGVLQFQIQNIPSDTNPKTGRLVAMSVVHQLLARRAPIAVG